MIGPYTLHPEVHDGHGNYVPAGQPVAFASLADARAALRRITAETGVVPRVTDGRGTRVWIVPCADL